MLITPDALCESITAVDVTLNESVLDELMAYCEHAAIDDIHYFMEQACCYLLSQDKAWVNTKITD